MSGRAPEFTLSPLGEMLRTGDPDRFEASLFAPSALRERLFTLYAFNLELARTPWRVSEPQIGAIRLRWWLDVVAEAAAGETPRAHPIAEPLARLVYEVGLTAADVEPMVTARLRDLDPEPIEDRAAFDAYVEAATGTLMRLAVQVAGGGDADSRRAAEAVGYALGAANLLRAAPELIARGRLMLPVEGDPEARRAALRGETTEPLRASLHAIAATAQERIRAARRLRARLPRSTAPAFLTAWRADAALAAAARPDMEVMRDLGEESPFRRRAALLWRGFTGRW